MDNFEKTPFQIASEPTNNRQESLQKQLNSLNPSVPGDEVLGSYLSRLYEHYQLFDQEFSTSNNILYQPKFALLGNITPSPRGNFGGIYEYQPITEAIKTIDDHFNIFPEVETIFRSSDGKSNRQIITEITQTVTKKTGIPIFLSSPSDIKQLLPDDWVMVGEDQACRRCIDQSRGMRNYIYHVTPEIFAEIKVKGYSEHMSYTPVGSAIIINDEKCDDPGVIQTCLHELGHIVEDKFVIPQKLDELKDKPIRILGTEIMSSLYGIKAALIMANTNKKLAFDMIDLPVRIYNWTLTGTTAP